MPRGDGITVRDLGNGIHEFRWRDEGHSKRKRITCTPEKATQIKAAMMSKTGRTATIEHTFNDLATDYLKWATRQKCYKHKKGIIKRLQEKFGNSPLPSITTHEIDKYQSEILASGKAPATANRYIACLKHMMTKADEWKWISEGTLKESRKIKMLKENNKRLRYLTEDEYSRLLVACGKTRAAKWLTPIVAIAVNTGMRQGEIMGLRWDQIDMKNQMILLTDTKNGDRREVPLNEAARGAFSSLPHRIDGGKVFKAEAFNDQPFMAALRMAGIKDFRFHDLRHTFASWLIMAGEGLATVQSLLGHKTITMTLRYAHLSQGHRSQAVARLDTIACGNVATKTADK